MAQRKSKVSQAADGVTPRPVAIPNPGGPHDQVQGGDPDSGTFEWVYVVLPPFPGADVVSNGAAAAETAALQAGYRPTGPAVHVSTDDHPDGVSKTVTWQVPVVRNVGVDAAQQGALAEPSKPGGPGGAAGKDV